MRLGLQPGFPDLLIQWPPGRSLWIEMKTRGGILSDVQKAMHARLHEIGIPVHTARSVDDVIELLQLYEVPMKQINFGGKHGNTRTEGRSPPQPAQGTRA